MTIISSVESILEDLHRYVIPVSNCVSDKDQELQEFIPIDLSDIPNKMGINLCSVKDIEWEKQDNGELTYVKINYKYRLITRQKTYRLYSSSKYIFTPI